jgi:hypothetical protein
MATGRERSGTGLPHASLAAPAASRAATLASAAVVVTATSRAYRPKELAQEAYRLYQRFRPDIPAGK